MKKVLLVMGVMIVIMVGGAGLISMIFSSILGGGIEQSFIYPIYGGIILLSGIVVGVAGLILDEIKVLRKDIDEIKRMIVEK